MKAIGKHEVIARIAGLGLVLGAVFALVLSGSSVVRAQASAISPAVPAAAPAKAAPTARAGQSASPSNRQPGGTHEGIKVHGHWMIEVKRPDGKLVSHTEFENSLVGPALLADMLFGYDVPGGYKVILTSGAAGSGPCPALSGGSTSCTLVGSLFSPEPASFGDLASGCGGVPSGLPNQITATGPCFPLSLSTLASALVFSGTAVASPTATYPAQITDVYLDPLFCVGLAPASCAQGLITISGDLTHATLPKGPPPGTAPNLCGETGQVSCAVTVPAAGDTISVQVTISFQ